MTKDNWGNQPIPGFDDITDVRKAFLKAEQGQRNKDQAKDPLWKANQKKGVKTAWDSPHGKKRKKVLGKKISKFRKENPREYTEEERKNIKRRGREWHQDPDKRARFEAGIKARNERGPTKKQLESSKKAGLKKRRKVHTPDGVFGCMQEAAEYYGIGVGSMSDRCKYTAPKWKDFYIQGECRKTGPRKKQSHHKRLGKQIKTPDGIFDNLRTASKHYKVHSWTIKSWTRLKPKQFKILT